MKSYIALVLAFAVLNAAPSEAFIGSLINSVVTAVVDTVTTVVDTVTTVVDTVVYVGNFLWENTVDPTIQVIVESKRISKKLITHTKKAKTALTKMALISLIPISAGS